LYDRSGDQPVVNGIKVLRAKAKQHFSPNLLEVGQLEGWLTRNGNVLTIKSDPPLVYRIVRTPGYYCCHCNRPLDDGGVARSHLSAAHADEESPDPANPAGYRRDNFYAAERED
jgi:hypothetical protein